MNLVMLAKPLMEARGPITSFAQLEELTNDVISVFNLWGKYGKTGLSSCPDLSVSGTVNLSSVQEGDAAPILDIPRHCYKKIKGDDEGGEGWMLTEEDMNRLEDMVMEVEQVEEPVEALKEYATFGEYMKGPIQYLGKPRYKKNGKKR